MPIISALPSAAKESATGSHRLSSETASLADGDTVTFEGDIVEAWADSNAAGVTAHVTDETDSTATLEVLSISDGTAAAASSVTVFAVIE